jgi:hypothetical protein
MSLCVSKKNGSAFSIKKCELCKFFQDSCNTGGRNYLEICAKPAFMEANFILSLIVITIVAVLVRFLPKPNRRQGKPTKALRHHDYTIY